MNAGQRAAQIAEAARREVEEERDAFKERNHHAMDLARLSPALLRTDCNRVDHAVEDMSKALSAMEAGLEAIAEGDCHYGDGCPPFGLKHYRCDPCRAREALAEARGKDYCTDGSCSTCKAGEPCH